MLIQKAKTIVKKVFVREVFEFLLSALLLISAATALFLYSKGYRLQKAQEAGVNLKVTGLLSVKSYPEGANVYLNGVLSTATNNTISGIEPGTHLLKISRNGYVTWSKEVEVFPELATDITALLISQSPRLEPLTNTGATNPVMSPSLTKVAFFSQDSENPGIWVIPLTDRSVNLFRSNPYVIAPDSKGAEFSKGNSLIWSPDDKEILVELPQKLFYLLDIDTKSVTPVADWENIRTDWESKTAKKRRLFIEKLDIPENLREVAVKKETQWAPDEKKFLYTVENGTNTEYRVYNSEKPLPVGEKIDNLVFSLPSEAPQPKITWYPDSFHLILSEGFNQETKNGTVSIIRIDGTNKTEIYKNTLLADFAYSVPGGDKVMVLTTFKSNGQADLYTIGLR